MVSLYVAWSMFFAPIPPDITNEQDPSLDNNRADDNPGNDDDSQGNDDIQFDIELPDFFNATLSTKNGGTFIQYSLPHYLGKYSTETRISRGDVGYDVDSPFGFLFDDADGFSENLLGCNPCIEEINIKDVSVSHNGEPVVPDSKIVLKEEEEIIFTLSLDSGERVTHTITFTKGQYGVHHSYSGLPDSNYTVVWKNGIAPAERFAWEDNNNYCAGYVDGDGDEAWNERNTEHDLLTSKEKAVEWAGVRNKFFISAIVPHSKNRGASLVPIDLKSINYLNIQKTYLEEYKRTDVPAIHDIRIRFDSSNSIDFDTFLAPLDYSIMSAYESQIDGDGDRNLEITKIMTLGFWPLSEISKIISQSLQFLYGFVNFAGYGLILILFAFIVRLISGPITKRSLRSTQKMQTVQPLIKSIQEKYKSDPKKMQTKIMQTYKENGVNPLSGCLLMFLQWPIMIPPFIIFRSAVELRSESFLWIKDLSQPDYLISLPFDIPWLGTGEGWTGVGVLPLLMGFTLYLTMKKTMASSQGQNKMMMYMMNVMFVLLFNSFPAGLNLYYVCYNVLNYLQQRKTSQEETSVSLFSKLKGLLQKQKK